MPFKKQQQINTVDSSIFEKDPLNGKKLRIGIISPYSFETPGGVQLHIRDFAETLIQQGHTVEVLAPGRRTRDMPLWVQTNGSSFSIHYNGSIARLSYFGIAGLHARRWVKQGHFDIVHLHEPEAPSLSHKPLVMVRHPALVGTFHASFDTYPFALRFFEHYLHRYLAPLSGAICVSGSALNTARHYLPDHIPVDIIPNGIHREQFLQADILPQWKGTQHCPTIGFLGRMGESRKGFAVFAHAAALVLRQYPDARFLCVGDGQNDAKKIVEELDPSGGLTSHFEFLGRLSEERKAQFYRSLSVYVATQTGGESFGIVLAEAMSAGCPIVASDLEAFRAVSNDASAAALFDTGDAEHCSQVICELLSNETRQQRLRVAGLEQSKLYDWKNVAYRVLSVYERALS